MENKAKMVIVVRKDLNMRKGKIAAQASHAAIGAVLQELFTTEIRDPNDYEACSEGWEVKVPAIVSSCGKEWLTGEFTKICVSVDSESELLEVYNKAKTAGLNVCLITDAGHTEFHGNPTLTCLAIGPCYSQDVDPITKNLKLF